MPTGSNGSENPLGILNKENFKVKTPDLLFGSNATRGRGNKRNTVEKTVEHLETQVKSLLGLLEDLAWNLPPGPFSPAPDLLGDDHF
ncbi:Placenta-specific protein 9 [Fukomys damarensis]|uniref:Placenta-specific protein 9 n=1 Tax=Fukomys damarensis TaxID=885580 RepID=A0A091DYV5_FUKDA|nr:Placenta-specific protein 9 [Fukomys damarensis]